MLIRTQTQKAPQIEAYINNTLQLPVQAFQVLRLI